MQLGESGRHKVQVMSCVHDLVFLWCDPTLVTIHDFDRNCFSVCQIASMIEASVNWDARKALAGIQEEEIS